VKRKLKVLFIYPNISGARRIPLAISILSSCLKKAGYSVDVFDATFYQKKDKANDLRVKIGIFKDVDMSSVYTRVEEGDTREDFIKKVASYKPDIIAVTLLQDNYFLSQKILKGVKNYSTAFVVAGGHLPTSDPQKVLSGLDIDAVVMGEGEIAIVELADNIVNKRDPYTLLSAHQKCYFFRFYFDFDADLQNSSSLIFSRLNISF